MTAVLLYRAVGCTTSAPPTGAALVPGATTSYGLAPLKPGTQLGLLAVDLVNWSHSPITLEFISGIGRSLGAVIRVVEVQIAPARGNMPRYG